MTDLIERTTAASADDAAEAGGATATSSVDLAPPDAALMGTLLGAAGIVHLVMGPSHLGASALEGWGFLVSGWVQVALAIGVVVAARRWMLWAGVAANVVLVVLWAWSRTQGLPFGAHANHPETVSWVDGSTVAFELLFVGLAGLALLRPGAFALKGGAFAVGIPLAVFAVATAALATPEARDHSAHSHGGHSSGSGGGGMAAADAGHDHGAAAAGPAAVDDKGLSELENGHQHGQGQEELDDATQTLLTQQLAGTAELVRLYPTLADAEAAGYLRSGPFVPGLGTHYARRGAYDLDGAFDPATDILTPLLIYDGVAPESPLAGFMYYVLNGEAAPEGFAGPNDIWHHHENLCIVSRPDGTIDSPFGADDDRATEELCTEVGGRWIAMTGYMLHVWTVPGYESTRGVFSEINPAITCPDGTYHQVDRMDYGTRLSTCREN